MLIRSAEYLREEADMNKDSFISRLDELLKDLPDTERIEALEYYQEYFDDAGVENEASVLQELGSPEEVAHNIRGELAEKELVLKNQQQEKQHENTDQTESRQQATEPKKKNPVVVGILVALLCIFAIPVGIPMVTGAFGIVVGILATLAGIVIALYVGAFALLFSGIVLVGVAIVNCIVAPLVAALLLGVGLLLFGLGLLFLLGGIKVCTTVIPGLIRGITSLLSRLFHRGEACAA